jgi:hypothetical protein
MLLLCYDHRDLQQSASFKWRAQALGPRGWMMGWRGGHLLRIRDTSSGLRSPGPSSTACIRPFFSFPLAPFVPLPPPCARPHRSGQVARSMLDASGAEPNGGGARGASSMPTVEKEQREAAHEERAVKEAASLGGAHATLRVSNPAPSAPSPRGGRLLSRCFGGQHLPHSPPMQPQFGILGLNRTPKATQVHVLLPSTPPSLAPVPQQKLTPADAVRFVLRSTVCMSSVMLHTVDAALLARAAERLCALYPPLAGRMVKHIPR